MVYGAQLGVVQAKMFFLKWKRISVLGGFYLARAAITMHFVTTCLR
jgi:hypothetical protein